MARGITHFHGGRSSFQPETTYHFGPSQDEEEAQAGAGAWRNTFQQALALAQHNASQRYDKMHYDLALAKMQREEIEDRAKAEQKMKYETMMAQAIPELYSIDPADKDAHSKMAAVVKEYPQLGGYKDFMQHVAGYRGLIEGARKATEGEDFKTALQAQKSGDIDDRQTERLQHTAELAAQKAQAAKDKLQFQSDLKKATGPSDQIQTRYQQAVNNTANFQKQLDQTQAYIDEQTKKPDEGPGGTDKEKVLPGLIKSRDNWQRQLDKETATKEALELVHPQLNPAFKTEAMTPEGPVDTSSAPVASRTATPTGEMDTSGSTNGTAAPVESAETTDAAAPDSIVSPVVDAPAVAAVNPIIAPNTGAQVTTAETGAAVEPHPFEGQRKLQKSTGKYGTFVNGVFVPES